MQNTLQHVGHFAVNNLWIVNHWGRKKPELINDRPQIGQITKKHGAHTQNKRNASGKACHENHQ